MARQFNRRQVLGMGLGAAGALMGGRAIGAWGQALAPAILDRAKDAPNLPVAIQRCETYEPAVVRAKLDAALALVGGIKDLVSNKTVTIKLNITGGPGKLAGLPAFRTYHVHPNVVAALCAALHDAGATRIYIVESQYSAQSPEEVLTGGGWDVNSIKAAGGRTVSFEDTRNRGQFADYSKLAVPGGGLLFPAFMVNQRYEKTDVFISLAKMKDHSTAGITLAVKNLFGMPPTSLYGNDAPNENTTSYRGAILHDGSRLPPGGVPAPMNEKLTDKTSGSRVPRATADMLCARPVDLAIIDGIETNRGGEGPWCPGVEPLAPKLLFVGRNAVCTDAIATAAMGYDPQTPHRQGPFPGENHLLLLAQLGAGVIDPKRMDVRGLALKAAIFPFARGAQHGRGPIPPAYGGWRLA